jgi:phage repressor protein C with HTH and peptisase S24 domain
LTEIEQIASYFEISAKELLFKDLQNLDLSEKTGVLKNIKNVDLKLDGNLDLTGKKQLIQQEIKITVAAEEQARYGNKSTVIPITDISVAAGDGHFNNDYIENVESLRLPIQFLKPNSTYLCVKIKGVSMSPTLQDGGYVIIRQLDRSEWAKMPDERIFVISDREGKTVLKRVKNRFKQGFIVCRSDSPDQATFPTFNLQVDEINSIWYVEWYFSAKMPNIHDQFYSRLQLLEDRVDELANMRRIN